MVGHVQSDQRLTWIRNIPGAAVDESIGQLDERPEGEFIKSIAVLGRVAKTRTRRSAQANGKRKSKAKHTRVMPYFAGRLPLPGSLYVLSCCTNINRQSMRMAPIVFANGNKSRRQVDQGKTHPPRRIWLHCRAHRTAPVPAYDARWRRKYWQVAGAGCIRA